MKLLKRKFTSSLALFVVLSATQLASAFYDPSAGRWLSRDPIAETGGRNLTGFCSNKPSNAFDRDGLEEIGSVVTITPAPLPNEEQGKHQEGQRIVPAQKWEAKDPNRILFIVTSLKEANEKLRNCKKCVQTLNIQGHGTPGYQSIAAEDGSYQDFPQRDVPGHENDQPKGIGVTGYLDPGNTLYSKTGVGFEVFKGVKFCKPCTIVLRGCNVGLGRAGKNLMQLIHKETGCLVKAYSVTTVADEDDGLSGRNSWWFGSYPNVEYPDPILYYENPILQDF